MIHFISVTGLKYTFVSVPEPIEMEILLLYSKKDPEVYLSGGIVIRCFLVIALKLLIIEVRLAEAGLSIIGQIKQAL
jgi:hypothetical protein